MQLFSDIIGNVSNVFFHEVAFIPLHKINNLCEIFKNCNFLFTVHYSS